MAGPILVPQVGQDLTEAKIVAINVRLGDRVAKGDIVAEVESEKATFEVEAFSAGVVLAIHFAEGDLAPVLEPLMLLGEPGANPVAVPVPVAAPAAAPVAAAAASVTAAAAPETPGRRRSSPLARRVAAQGGLSLHGLAGSGPRGAIVLADVQRALATVPVAAARAGQGMATLQAGQGAPVVFLHGFGAEIAAWRGLVVRMTLPNALLAFDLAGHGAAPLRHVAGFDAIVDDIAARLAAAGIDRAHLVGHSLGAAVAVALADRGQMDIRSSTLIAPAGLDPWMSGDFIAGFLGATSETALARWMQMLVRDPARLPAAMVRATFAARAGTDLVQTQATAAAALFQGSTQLFDVRAALARLPGAVRIIQGADDTILRAGGVARDLPAAVALHLLPGTGHLPQIEAPALVAQLIAQTVLSAGG